jgi:chemotaxis protein CheX
MNNASLPLKGSECSPLQLTAVLDLKAAADLHRDILARRGHDLVLDASDVTRLGGQCLQVLLGAVFAWRADGKSFSFDRPSAAFISALDMFGFVFDGGIHKEQLV